MSTTVLPPSKSSAPHRRPLRLSTDPEKRSVQIGALGTILVHILVFLALWHWRVCYNRKLQRLLARVRI